VEQQVSFPNGGQLGQMAQLFQLRISESLPLARQAIVAGELTAQPGYLGRGGYSFWLGLVNHGARRQANLAATNLPVDPIRVSI
jgi:hypothetical protein